jgi:flagellar hook assembly protein FlgD
MPANGDVTLEVYDVAGRRVRSEQRSLAAGWQAVTFDGRDGNGRALPSGVYFYRVSAAGQTRTAKMVIQR